mmetsp:Transcript_60411/g.184557  ORF Transcript_60411/g.184557 Transcript_60411/m.184557 type:complete len:209 (+) Transcript_60411:824-1450(+)
MPLLRAAPWRQGLPTRGKAACGRSSRRAVPPLSPRRSTVAGRGRAPVPGSRPRLALGTARHQRPRPRRTTLWSGSRRASPSSKPRRARPAPCSLSASLRSMRSSAMARFCGLRSKTLAGGWRMPRRHKGASWSSNRSWNCCSRISMASRRTSKGPVQLLARAASRCPPPWPPSQPARPFQRPRMDWRSRHPAAAAAAAERRAAAMALT